MVYSPPSSPSPLPTKTKRCDFDDDDDDEERWCCSARWDAEMSTIRTMGRHDDDDDVYKPKIVLLLMFISGREIRRNIPLAGI